MVAIRATGAAEIAAVAAAVRKLGKDRTIVNTMAKEIRRGTKPIILAVKERAVEILPSSGGLGKWVARARITGVMRRGATTAGVLIRGGRNSKIGRTDLRGIDLGRTRHMTFGQEPWHPQRVRAGFFTDAVTEEGLDQLEAAVIAAAERAQETIVNA